MIQLIYTSRAAVGFSGERVEELLDQARRANQALGITGILLYDGDLFVQLLEGEAADVDALFDRIKRDQRHAGIQPLIREDIPERQFSNWSMAYAFYEEGTLRRFGGTMDAKTAAEFGRVLKAGKSFVREFFAEYLLEFSERK
jgi:hypothetical protein